MLSVSSPQNCVALAICPIVTLPSSQASFLLPLPTGFDHTRATLLRTLGTRSSLDLCRIKDQRPQFDLGSHVAWLLLLLAPPPLELSPTVCRTINRKFTGGLILTI